MGGCPFSARKKDTGKDFRLTGHEILLYCIYNKKRYHDTPEWEDGSDCMVIKIDFNSDEALYIQLRNQIIIGIATSQLQEGESLPSVRQLADSIGINMHTVNKAYALLRQEGFVKLDRRKGAVISLDINKLESLMEMKENLRILLAEGCCKNITRDEVHQLIDDIYMEYE